MQYVMKGGKPLIGVINIGGAKNSALGILAAAVLTSEEVVISNVPDVMDTNIMLETISDIGVSVEKIDRHTVKIKADHIHDLTVSGEYVNRIRASYYLLGALLGRFGEANVSLPGGCAIGVRPMDQHLKGFRQLGAKTDVKYGMVEAKAEGLYGAHIFLDVVSVGATINIMLASALAHGKTVIENAAKEPHVVDVANMLNSMGANIKGAGTDIIRINGARSLHGTNYTIIPDQIEAGTFMMAAAITKGDVTVRNVVPKHLESISAKLREMGCKIHEFDDAVRVIGPKRLNSTQVKTLPYPGLPTDMQPQFTTALALSSGTSLVTESIFENRFKYVDELARMGANITVEGNVAIVMGVTQLTGSKVVSPDLRAGAALVLAGLAAEGYTVVDEIVLIHRGYEDFHLKLASLGASIEMVEDDREADKFRFRA